ncbi:1,2-phenylacetyl-CoA epoxidase subunit PaaD [Rhodococcus sp. ACT016]|uniref:1,2-phenylacetyl-CoA epoxidase subunit PaaD n=1 Tax=Rhodococcus sp. ACT016 TaxID=3134808 RepID=UPI003D2DF31D
MAAAAHEDARTLVESVIDPEMPMLTLADLGVIRDVDIDQNGAVVVTITPTYSGCPALATMRVDIEQLLNRHGYNQVRVDTSLTPPWSSDWITESGMRKLREAGYSPPGRAPAPGTGPVPLTLTTPPRAVSCPQCGSPRTELVSEFGATLCKAHYRCIACLEPFDHVKEI